MRTDLSFKKIFFLLIFISCASPTKKEKINIPPKTVVVNPASFNEQEDYFTDRGDAQSVFGQETIEFNANLDFSIPDDGQTSALELLARYCLNNQFVQAYTLIDSQYSLLLNNPSYWNIIGNCYLRQKQPQIALLYYSKALALKANYHPAYNNIGVIYYLKGSHQIALESFKKANHFSPQARTPIFNLAQIYLQYGHTKKSILLLTILFELNKKDDLVLEGLVQAFMLQGQREMAQKIWVESESEKAKKYPSFEAYWNKLLQTI